MPRAQIQPRRAGEQGQYGSGAPLLLLAIVGVGLLIVGQATGWGAFAVWWLTNAEPPSIVLDGPSGPVRGVVQIAAQVSPADRVTLVRASLDDQPLTVSSPVMIDTRVVPDGDHRLLVEVEDSSRLHNRAEAEWVARSDNTPPRLTVELTPPAVEQGGTLEFKAQTDEPGVIEAILDGKQLDLHQEAGLTWAVVGIEADDSPRAVALKVRATDQVGNAVEQALPAQITPRDFTRDRVQVSARLAALLEERVRAEEDAHLAPTYARVSPVRLWSGRFLVPVRGEVITQWGEIRSYNGGPFEGHHGGIDIAAAMGSPVLAPARATVTLVDQVSLRGNVVVLDHGLGIFTTYAHLSTVDVKVGDEVQRGDAFAKVGTTGLSEGPHLHWELWVSGHNVDPLPWTERAIP